MDTKKSGRRYDREFKENAVALVRGGRSATEVARDLGVSTWSLNRWVALIKAGAAPTEPKTLAAETPDQRELRRLRQENDYLRRQRDILKKLWASGASRDAPRLFALMETMKEEFSIPGMAEALEVSKSGFHAHGRKAERPRRRRDAELRTLLHRVFEQSRRTYGSPRLRLELRDAGHRCGKNRVNRLMREQGLRARQKRRFRPQTTDSRHPHKVAENWLAKVPAPDWPGQVWQSDFTYVETGEGWLYLAFTLDACSRCCLAHHCREDMSAELTLATLAGAARRQRPMPSLIHHSDRGVQYACAAFRQQLQLHGVTASMSHPGNPYDNALAESFVATLKTECFGEAIPQTKAAAKLMAFDYIESFYNRRRRHSSLGYQSPADFEKTLFPPNQKPVTQTQTN
jgi:putative transposase